MALACVLIAGGAAAERPNVILIILDTARADRFSSHGDPRSLTPHFDRFAADAVRFRAAHSTSSWTVPAHASIFTGLYPVTHQAHQETQYLANEFSTLAEILSEAGYATAAFSTNAWVSPRSNLIQGFDTAEVVAAGPLKGTGLPHRQNALVAEWLDAREADRPFFLFVNHVEPHWRYFAPEPWRLRSLPDGDRVTEDDPVLFPMQDWYLERASIPDATLAPRSALYDAEIAYADAILGELLRIVERRDLLQRSLVIVTSDHGENLGDHDHMAHVFSLYESTLRVPLAIRPPGGNVRALRTDPVQLLDLFPTILAACGLEEAAGATPGFELLRGDVPRERPILAEYYFPDQVLGVMGGSRREESVRPFQRRIRSLLVGDDKLVWGSDEVHELYDLRRDPGELRNRISADPERAERMKGELQNLLERHVGRPQEIPAVEVDPEVEKQLRALGYVK